MIKECEFIQRLGRTIKMRLQEEDGSFKNHYHRYMTEEKAAYMYEVFSKGINENGGVIC